MSSAAPNDPALVTVREAVLRLLSDFGMTRLFGNPGSTELPLFRDLPPAFDYVLGLQECVAIGMADGFAQATRNAAFVNLHSAAGVGHAMGNVFTAFRNRTPLVITAGQQARSMLQHEPFLFATQATELPKPYVKWSCEPARAQDVPAAIARAYYIAMQPPRGPVFVSVPVDDWDQLTEPLAARALSSEVRGDAAGLQQVAQALDAARRPVFVVGPEVDREQAWGPMVELAERHQARVWVSPMSPRCSFPESHPLFAGFLPAGREAIVQRLAGHDVVLGIGAPVFTYHTEGFGPHLPEGTSFYQLTEDPDLCAWTPVGHAVRTSVRFGLEDLLALSRPPRREPPPGRAVPPRLDERGPLSVAFLMQTLAAVRPADAVVVEEAPSSRPTMQAHLPFDMPDSFHTCASGGLGHGLPAAVGVALARAPRRTLALIGDGSAMYAIQGLWSAATLKLPITFVIINNHRYQALDDFAKVFGIDRPVGTTLAGLDFVSLAAGMGVPGRRITQAAELAAALQGSFETPSPTLIEVVVD